MSFYRRPLLTPGELILLAGIVAMLSWLAFLGGVKAKASSELELKNVTISHRPMRGGLSIYELRDSSSASTVMVDDDTALGHWLASHRDTKVTIVLR